MRQDLVMFLHARLDEEAVLARRCDGDGCGEWTAHGHTVDFCQGELSSFHPTIALHVALHDPARVLREVEAKRRVLARHVLSPATGDPELPWDNRDDCQYDGETWPCDDLLDLASPYADHPDYPRRRRLLWERKGRR
ncbi:DUF6221 family protein [Streptomyces sp. McG3]|uniref:DUF6221 family protein n=1 Tax=Streptomyces sp. McG3 TaxID=2725483 RepID=UPI001BEA5A1F|nr:DUF6221 family protein [Streptomyces sp. McG3]MBT2895339.1 hypothetical protein [Streptomyces sp. McG3]